MAEKDEVTRESGSEWFSRNFKRQSVTEACSGLFNSQLTPGTIAEIQGDPGAGKTLFLSHFVCNCILPKDFCGVPLDGLETSVLLVDCDYDFSLRTVASMLVARVEGKFKGRAVKPFSGKDLEALVMSSMRRLLLKRLKSVEEAGSFVSKLRRALILKPDIAVVVWDSISAFHWTKPRDQMINHYSLTARLFKEIGVPVIVSVQTLFAAKTQLQKGERGLNWQNFLGPAWKESVSQSVMLEKIKDEGDFLAHFRGSPMEQTPFAFKMNLKLFEVISRSDGAV